MITYFFFFIKHYCENKVYNYLVFYTQAIEAISCCPRERSKEEGIYLWEFLFRQPPLGKYSHRYCTFLQEYCIIIKKSEETRKQQKNIYAYFKHMFILVSLHALSNSNLNNCVFWYLKSQQILIKSLIICITSKA